MTRIRLGAWVLLGAVAIVAVSPGFFSPYPPTRQYRELPFAPPGRYHGASVHWFVRGEPYRWLGVLSADVHLFGAPEPGRVFLLGTDEFGRDVFTRLCHGASISLVLAPVAALCSIALAVVLGALGGMRGGVTDAFIRRVSEAFVVLPWFYAVIALRAALPLTLSEPAAMLVVFALLAVLGCASPSRLFRGLVLSLKDRDFVVAARAMGAGGGRILRRHVLPSLWPSVKTQVLLSIPAYIVTEATLSFLGLGLSEPTPTWGGMLVPLQQYSVLTGYPWMWTPAIAIVTVCLALHIVGTPVSGGLGAHS